MMFYLYRFTKFSSVMAGAVPKRGTWGSAGWDSSPFKGSDSSSSGSDRARRSRWLDQPSLWEEQQARPPRQECKCSLI